MSALVPCAGSRPVRNCAGGDGRAVVIDTEVLCAERIEDMLGRQAIGIPRGGGDAEEGAAGRVSLLGFRAGDGRNSQRNVRAVRGPLVASRASNLAVLRRDVGAKVRLRPGIEKTPTIRAVPHQIHIGPGAHGFFRTGQKRPRAAGARHPGPSAEENGSPWEDAAPSG